MYLTKGAAHVTDSRVDLHLSDTAGWGVLGGLVAYNVVLLGHHECGPLLIFSSVAPGVDIPCGESHGHASDNFRIVMRGELTMGKTRYAQGEFRFQQGWRPYPGDNFACGPDGGWSVVMMGDRRGSKVRPAKGELHEEERAMELAVANKFGLRGDFVSEDQTSGPSALVTEAGAITNSGNLNGSFADAASWPAVNAATRVAGALMGDPTHGPIVVLSSTEPGAEVTPAFSVGTEILRFVIRGSCLVDGEERATGDITLYPASAECPRLVAGPAGYDEVLIVADRSCAQFNASSPTWLDTLDTTVDSLSADLAATA